MSENGWEQRLDDLGQARELREAIVRTLADSDPVSMNSLGDYRTQADALLSGPLAPLLAAQAAVERVEGEIAEEVQFRADLPAWEISVMVPAEAGEELFQGFFDAIADAAYETQPEDRQAWDIFVSSTKNPTSVPVHLLRAALDGTP